VAGECPAAMNNLGRMVLDSQAGLFPDPEKGIGLLEQGARAYDDNAALKMAAIYRDGEFGHRKSQRQRIYWL
jgi:TPR repeat protein